MASLNKVMLIGNLGRDPEIRFLPNGDPVANFSIATSEKWKDKQGQAQEKTEWHNIVMFGKVAEIAGQYLKKGSPVYLEGKLQTRKWQDKNTGQDRYSTEVVADVMKMLGGRDQQGAPAQQSQQAPAPQQPAQAGALNQPPNRNAAMANEDFEDDDIPF